MRANKRSQRASRDDLARSRLMSNIATRDTDIERLVRLALMQRGYAIKLNVSALPGAPDIILPAYKRAIFVHGCFWHSHACSRGTRPRTNTRFWNDKLDGNRRRDIRNQRALRKVGWKVSVIWQCRLREGILRVVNLLTKSGPRPCGTFGIPKRKKMSCEKPR